MNWLSGIFVWLASLFNGSTSISEIVTKVQAYTVQLCGFLPMAESVVALLGATPVATGAMVIARKICAAVQVEVQERSTVLTLGGDDKPTTVIVDGVVVQGTFVDKPN